MGEVLNVPNPVELYRRVSLKIKSRYGSFTCCRVGMTVPAGILASISACKRFKMPGLRSCDEMSAMLQNERDDGLTYNFIDKEGHRVRRRVCPGNQKGYCRRADKLVNLER